MQILSVPAKGEELKRSQWFITLKLLIAMMREHRTAAGGASYLYYIINLLNI
jgi:hypothetical protein